ncbi:NADH dehydrogenase subunit 11 (mitochondrion) [Hemiselmis andersenii]|uniref:NADH dehydrogenase subunit 11 n=1 Tax=Hemiselmis andersenii TaxID=464988 RepID=B2MWS2_HEMAN|nr:NADH dehydrogenase subunit 11 [Hemiselmis andersenii]ACC78214.1 NADH dehydrogenase subunit 11 [Hemiselmis andersenii]
MNFQIIIDNQPVNVNNNMSILQACESAQITVPRFCYHERLSVAGNCRMCLVEISKAPKLAASCAMPVIQNMVVFTDSLVVKKAREGVLEFLLVNHPLDCPVCDQGGECDLQDQTMTFGSDRSRFREYKRAVEDKQCGPLIKTVMTRCIHCTRCVRFANEVIGLPALGTSGRGNLIEIGLYIKKLFTSELSGNIIDLCPVGALTSKPYTFAARPWELKSVESIDTFDAVGSNIRIDIRGYEIMRILPRLNEKINEEWISDKTRFAFDGLKRQRLYDPLLNTDGTKFEVISWQVALQQIVTQINQIKKPFDFCAQLGPQSDLESTLLLKQLITKKNGTFINFHSNACQNNVDFKTAYRFNTTISNLEKADFCLFLGINPRIEASLINLRLRKRYVSGNFKAVAFGTALNLTFPIYNLGSTVKALVKFVEGRHQFCEYLAKASTPTIIVGQSFIELFGESQARTFINVLINNSKVVKTNWNGLNFVTSNAGDVGACELGIKTKFAKNLDIKLLYCLGEANFKKLGKNTFIIYQGHQGKASLLNANLILPCSAFTEKTATFVNVEGRYQKTKLALLPPGEAKEDSNILYAIIDSLNMGFDGNVANFLYKHLFKSVSTVNFKKVVGSTFMGHKFGGESKFLLKNTFIPSAKIENFYLADTVSELSSTMSKCSKVILNKSPFI